MAALVWPPVADRKQQDEGGGKKKLRLPFHSLALTTLRCHDGEAYWKDVGSVYGRAYYQAAVGHRYPPHLWPLVYCGFDVTKTYSTKERLVEMMR